MNKFKVQYLNGTNNWGSFEDEAREVYNTGSSKEFIIDESWDDEEGLSIITYIMIYKENNIIYIDKREEYI